MSDRETYLLHFLQDFANHNDTIIEKLRFKGLLLGCISAKLSVVQNKFSR